MNATARRRIAGASIWLGTLALIVGAFWPAGLAAEGVAPGAEDETAGVAADVAGRSLAAASDDPVAPTDPFALPPVPSSDRPAFPTTPQRGVVIPVHGAIEPGIEAHIKNRIAEGLAEHKATVFIFDIDSPGGRLDIMGDVVELISDLPEDVIAVAWIPRKAISAAAMIAFACDYVVMKDGALLGDIQPIMMSEGGYEVAGEKMQSYLRGLIRSKAARAGYPKALVEAMITQEIEVVEIAPKAGFDWRALHQSATFDSRFVNRRDFAEWEHVDDYRIVRVVVRGATPGAEGGESSTGVMGTTTRSGELLVLTGTEARETGFALPGVTSFDDLLRVFRVGEVHGSGPITTLGETWGVDIARWLSAIGPLLIMIGVIAIYFELQTAGLGIGAVVALAAFGLYFSAGIFIGLAESFEVVLFLVGVALLGVELFVVPGILVFAVTGVLAMLAALVLAAQPFVVPSSTTETSMFVSNVGGILLALLGAVVGMMALTRILPRMPGLRGLILTQPSARASLEAAAAGEGGGVPVGPGLSANRATATAENDRNGLRSLLGAVGEALTDLYPTGMAQFGAERVDVVTEGRYVEKGTPVLVSAVEGNRVRVRAYSAAAVVPAPGDSSV